MDENQANWKKLLDQTKLQDDRIEKLTNNLGLVQKEQTSMNSKLDELINTMDQIQERTKQFEEEYKK